MNTSNIVRRHIQTDDPFILDDLRQMALAPQYNYWIYSLLKPYLGQRILEIGPGIGNITSFMIQDATMLIGIEPNKYCSEVLLHHFENNPKFELIESKLEDINLDKLRKYEFDTVVCANVLEHISDDFMAIKKIKESVVSNGRLIILVPAMPQVHGPIDDAVGHFRRYTKKSLSKVLVSNELRVTNIFYSNFVGLLGWAFNAYISRSTQQSDAQIKIFNSLVPLLSTVEKAVKLPAGLSLIAVATKP